LIPRSGSTRAKAGFTPAFLFGSHAWRNAEVRARRSFLPCSKKILHCVQLLVTIRYYGSSQPAGGTTNMRAFALGLIFSAAAFPCLAQTVLKSEPFILAPYEVAFVQDPSCGAGKVRKVTGAIRGLQRRKACVTVASEQASLASATP
jgi:hypothetical protein